MLKIASPTGITTKAGPGVTIMTNPSNSTVAPTTATTTRRAALYVKCTTLLIKTNSRVLAFARFYRSLGTMIKRTRLSCLYIALLLSAAEASVADDALTAHAKESSAHLERRDATLSQVLLPTLEVAILAATTCPDDSEATSLTIGISDTHRHYRAEQFDDTGSLETAVSVPAGQLAPVSIPGFCVEGQPIDGDYAEGLELPGVATAQVSLRCRRDSDSASVYFVSVPIPVRVYCREDEDPEPSSEDR